MGRIQVVLGSVNEWPNQSLSSLVPESQALLCGALDALHYTAIREHMAALREKTTPTLIVSQNPSVFDCLAFESADDVRQTFILRKDNAGVVTYERMSEEAAQGFFEAYEVGFQQVSELLQVKGLW